MEDTTNQPSPINKSVIEIGPDENVLFTVYQHLFGIILIYILSMIGIITMLILTRFIFPSTVAPGSDSHNIFIASVFIVALIIAVLLVLDTVVYRKTKLIVTDKNIICVEQKGLFFKKITCLSLDDVEEVSSTKKGIFAYMFDFGMIKVETAGEQIDLFFNYCGTPDKITKIIYDAKASFNAKAALRAGSNNP